MTLALERIDRQPLAGERSDAVGVLAVLHDTLDAVSELDPDLLHSRTPAGRAIVSLAGLARAAAAVFGTDPGTALRTASGVVVVRDLVAAVTLLELATSRCAGPADPRVLEQMAGRAHAAYGRFLHSVRAAT